MENRGDKQKERKRCVSDEGAAHIAIDSVRLAVDVEVK
jgi:hypothetical protein